MIAIAVKQSSNDTTGKHKVKEQIPGTAEVSIFSSPDIAIQRSPSCPCGGGCPRCRGVIQPKLIINQPVDIYEKEADRVAEQIMRMPDPALQRKCAKCDEDKERLLKTKNSLGQIPVTQGYDVPSIVHEVLRSPGEPLDLATRAYMEPRFGRDFGKVRVHSDANAEKSARAVNANAYTVGQNIVFGADQFALGTHQGRRLIAHELTHIVQQSGVDDLPASVIDIKRGPSFGGPGIGDEGGKQIPRRPITVSVVALQRDWKDDLADEIAHDLNDYVAKNPTPYKHVIEVIHFSEKKELDDNVAAAFTELQSLAKLEKLAATPEGRAMLDVLYNAMMTGDVSRFESLQAARILYAKWKWMPTEVYKTAQLRDQAAASPAEIGVDQEASRIAHDLNEDVAKNRYREVINKINGLNSYIEDNVASHFLVLQSPDKLEKFAANNQGRAMLDVLYAALITGDVTDFERLQAERILEAKAKRPSTSPEQYLAQLKQETQYILPLRMQRTFRTSYAIFKATLEPNGKIKVRYDDEIHFWDADMFKEDRKNLPPESEAKRGFELDPDELVWLKLYDQREKLVPVRALTLIDYANQAMHQSVSVGVTAFEMGLFLGFGGLGAFSGAGARTLAAEVAAERASVSALRVAQGLLWADRVAMALPLVSMAINENREWILDKFPHAGPVLLGILDQANRITEYYGWARMGVEGARYLKSKLGPVLADWRAERAALKEQLNPKQERVANEIDNGVELVLNEANKAETEAGLAAVKYVKEHPETIKPGKPGERRATVGNHELVEVKDPATGVTHCEYHSDHTEITCDWLPSEAEKTQVTPMYKKAGYELERLQNIAEHIAENQPLIRRLRDLRESGAVTIENTQEMFQQFANETNIPVRRVAEGARRKPGNPCGFEFVNGRWELHVEEQLFNDPVRLFRQFTHEVNAWASGHLTHGMPHLEGGDIIHVGRILDDWVETGTWLVE